MQEPSQLAALIEPVARALLGEPNRGLSSKTELRFGSHGSLSVDLRKGTWYDHESQTGGGTLDLIERQTGLHEAERFDWLKENTDYRPALNGGGNGAAGGLGRIVATYPYAGADRNTLFEVVRYEPKTFRQRAPKPGGGYSWTVRGIKQVPYRLPELIDAIADDRTVYIVEGEKDVDKLWSAGTPATCNAGGVGKWHDELNEYFEGADVVIIPDYDPQKKNPKTGELMEHEDGRPILPGQDHAEDVAAKLAPVARCVRVLELWRSWPQMPLKGDVSDWLAAGGTVDRLHALAGDVATWAPGREIEAPVAAKPTVPVVFPFPIDGETIPRRRWIIPGLLLRRYLSVLVAPPGIGKSLLTLQIGMAACAGKVWANWRPRKRPRVMFINSEDDEDEMRRRLYAAQSVMGIDGDGLDGLAFAEQPETIVVARADSRTKTVVRTPMIDSIKETIIANGFDILIVDPFAETFEGDENSNSELKWAAVLWREIARKTNTGVLLVHHTKKYGAEAGNVDSSRGGSALTGVARIVSTLFPMTEREADAMGIDYEDRSRFLRFDDAKANLTLVTFAARWFEKKSFTIPNAGDDEPADEVGVLVPWTAPNIFDQMDVPTANKILDALKRGKLSDEGEPTGDPFCLKNTGNTDRWAGRAIQKYIKCDDGGATKILKKWIKTGLLIEYQAAVSNSKGVLRNCIRVLDELRPGTTTDSAR